MEHLFTNLTRSIEGTPGVALGAAFLWGVLSIVLSPCHLSSIPLIVGFVGQQGVMSAKRAFGMSLVFAAGIFVTIAVIGGITTSAGRLIGDVGRVGNYLVIAILFLVGLYLLDVIPFSWSAARFDIRRHGYLAAFALGLIFGVAVGPCTFAYMAPVLGVTFKIANKQVAMALALLLAYAAGHCSVIVVAGTSTELVERYLNWNETSRGIFMLKKVCGVLIILAGLWMLYKTL